ncbi:sigma-70 family RNA polymerase sigma factor [Maribacter algarum]|uniref:Sigma-70 family RNA polymerase sigma factor n=1 Tax=Maribacter algarum (ex Zhang et al. 2020) TaxID=2578118 RepID=A0A5S3PZZ5_9FLAO|nr:sigma-70 family RNA polymerase sigma factor [Maribacter algarum]TMM58907.1 sigma-70 family RNA polymerase sigma factor [Maribacter algarum]
MNEEQSHFEKIYQSNYQKVIRVCMGYVNGNDALAKDLTQEVFVKVWENLASFREEASIATWIYRITVNTCLLQLRKKKYLRGNEIFEKLTETPEESNPSKENQLKKMYQCINKLPKNSRGVILLELEGLPQKEIAEIMGLSHEAVRVRIHRIKNSLTQCVKNDSI